MVEQMAPYGENGSKASFMGMSADVLTAVERGKIMLALAPRGELTRSLLTEITEVARRKNLKPLLIGPEAELDGLYDILPEGSYFPSVIRIKTGRLYCPASSLEVSVSELSGYCTGKHVYENCPYLKNFDLSAFRKIAKDGGNTGPEQTQELIDKGMCPSRYLFDSATDQDIIISDYGLLFHDGWEKTLDMMGRKPKDTLLVVLDPYSLLDHIWSKYSFNLRREDLYSKDWELPGLDDRYVIGLQAIFDCLKKIMYDVEVGKQIEKSQLTSMYREATNDVELEVTMADIVQALRKILSGGGTFSTVLTRKKANDLFLFLGFWRSQFSGLSRLVGEDEDGFMVNVSLLDPHDVVENVLSHMGSAFFIGDTLYPHNIYARLLGISMENVLSRSYLDKDLLDNTRICCFTNVDTSLKNRNEGVYEMIAGNLKKVIDTTPGNTYVIFPSYDIMGNIQDHIDLYSLEKPVATEVRGAGREERHELMEELKGSEKAAVFCVQNGAVSGALDRGELFGDTTVMVGMHIPPPGPASDQKKNYFRKKFEVSGSSDLGYVISVWLPAIRSALNVIGNGLRRARERRNLIVLMDSRYRKRDIRAFFPKPYEILIVSSASDFRAKDHFPPEAK